jgi:hypothetical protein
LDKPALGQLEEEEKSWVANETAKATTPQNLPASVPRSDSGDLQ